MRDASIYSLELRVSMDGFSPETNDPIRGPGTFKRIMRGIKLLLDSGFLPIITAMRSWPIEQDEAQLASFKTSLTEIGAGIVRRYGPQHDATTNCTVRSAGIETGESWRRYQLYADLPTGERLYTVVDQSGLTPEAV